VSYPDLRSVPEPVVVVDVFRRPDQVVPVAEQAIEIGARALWLQPGAVNEDAAERARQAGLDVVTDVCIMVEHRRLAGAGALT
jgi:predicted CoA-binding protein